MSIAYTHAPTDPRVRRHCETLVRHGWKVYQLGLATQGEARVGRLNGVILIRLPRRRYRGGRLLRYLGSYLTFFLWARRMVARLDAKYVRVVQVNNIPNFLVWCARPARRKGARVILDIHDPEPELAQSKFEGRIGLRWISSLLAFEERLAARAADVVLCVHEQHLAVTISHGVTAAKIRVVVNYADDTLFGRRAPRQASPFVAYHGTVAARMGLDVVLRALALLRPEWPGLRGAVWGDGDAVPALISLRDTLGLGDAVEIPGRRFRLEEILPRLGSVGLGLVPVRRDVFTDVMLPTKLLEYVRLGIPVAVQRTPTIERYFPDDAVFYFGEFSPAGVAAVIRSALRDPRGAQDRARRAQDLTIARSWQENEREFVDIVQEGIGS